MRNARIRFCSLFALALISVMLIATPVFAYLYRAPVTITENASTSYDMLPVLWNQNNTWLASNGFMNSTANDTRVQTLGGLNRPRMVADNKTLTAIPVPADSQINLYFVTGESEVSAMDIIVEYGGTITTTPVGNLWAGGAPTIIEIKGYIDMTQVGKNIITYNGAANYRVYIKSTTTLALSEGGVDRIVTAPAIASDEYTITLTHDAIAPQTDFEIGGVNYGTWAGYPGAGGGNIVWLDATGTSLPYLEYITCVAPAVGADIYYQPLTIVNGTTMPDRNGANENGVITWGANPAGVGATLGSMVSSGQPSIGGASDTSTGDILPVVGGTDWRPDAGVSAALLANPMRPIVTAISDNTTLSERQVWVWFGIIFVVFITVLVGARVSGHHLITGIAASAAIILMVVWTVFPLLSLLVVILAIWGGLVSERSPSL